MFSATKSHARVPTIAATWWRTTTPIERPIADHSAAIRIPLPNSPANVPTAADTANPWATRYQAITPIPAASAASANTAAPTAATTPFAASTRSRFGVARMVGTIDPCRTSSV